MALSTIQGAYKVKQYILGGYLAEYQFKIIYRLTASNNDMRLRADEVLNRIADWAATRSDRPVLGEGMAVRKIESTSRASLYARYEGGAEDHQILMKLTYEVI